ncbi:FkbM family methyltransferase [Chryseobacterium sp. IT-36CA2]|uniref:FkbM family methyltransferase n=1 Tax=Chryseobacterium sp. IT-36CA2 TaxID=3026460 RepID=UPI0039E1876E
MKRKILSFINYLGYNLTKAEQKKIITGKSAFNYLSYHPTPIGNYFVPKDIPKDAVAEKMKRGLFYDENIIRIAKEYIKKDTIALDIGSNYGQMSLEFSKYVGENGSVYSFEAQKKVFDILNLNIGTNNVKNIKTFYNAVYDVSNKKVNFQEINLARFSSLGSFGIDINNNKNPQLDTISIDSIKFEKKISFMKIDIQGADLFALRGALNTIKRHKMAIIFEYEEQFQQNFGTTFQDYVDLVNEIDYKFVKTIDKINYLILPK